MINCILRRRVMLSLIFVTISINAFSASNKNSFQGTWINHRAKIIFDPGDSLRINLKLLPEKSGVFVFETVPVGNMELIRYSKTLPDKSNSQFLLFADKTDSTANISYGIPFVRVSGDKGVFGTWKNIRDLSEIRWDIGADFIEYNETQLDLNTGFIIVKERHRGTYTVGEGYYSGRFYVKFDDNVDAVIFPIVFGKIMYIFDMTPRRALFTVSRETPKADSLNIGVMAVNDSSQKK